MLVDAHMIADDEQTHRQKRKSNRRKELEHLRAENKELLKRIMIKNEQRKLNKSKAEVEVVKSSKLNKKGSHVMSNLGALLNGDIDQRLSNSATCNQPPPPPAHISIKEIDVDMISSISGMNEQPAVTTTRTTTPTTIQLQGYGTNHERHCNGAGHDTLGSDQCHGSTLPWI